MTAPNTHTSNPDSSKRGWRYRLGMVLFFGAFPIFFATPIVIPMLGFSAGESTALLGGILLAVEVLWIASIPLLGKEGFNEVKQRAFGWLKLPSGPISRTQHRLGMTLLIGSVLIDVLLSLVIVGVDLFTDAAGEPGAMFLGITFKQEGVVYTGTQILTTIGVLVAFFILGGDFWERIKSAFEWQPGKPDS